MSGPASSSGKGVPLLTHFLCPTTSTAPLGWFIAVGFGCYGDQGGSGVGVAVEGLFQTQADTEREERDSD